MRPRRPGDLVSGPLLGTGLRRMDDSVSAVKGGGILIKEKDRADSSHGNTLVALGTQRRGLKFEMPHTELSSSPVLSWSSVFVKEHLRGYPCHLRHSESKSK